MMICTLCTVIEGCEEQDILFAYSFKDLCYARQIGHRTYLHNRALGSMLPYGTSPHIAETLLKGL